MIFGDLSRGTLCLSPLPQEGPGLVTLGQWLPLDGQVFNECGPMAQGSATFQLFQRMGPFFTHMERNEHIFPPLVLKAPLCLLPLFLLPNSVLRSDKTKLKDQDCNNFLSILLFGSSYKQAVFGEKKKSKFMFDNSGVYLTSQ